MNNPFLDLVEKYNGFEYILGFIENEDHFIGGTGNKVWYYKEKGRTEECWLGELDGDTWTDKHMLLKGKAFSEESAEPGTAMNMILERAYFKQKEIAADGRKPSKTTISENECSHYVFAFGERAYDISDEYGVTVSYSKIDDISVGFRLRNIFTGSSVKPPKMK